MTAPIDAVRCARRCGVTHWRPTYSPLCQCLVGLLLALALAAPPVAADSRTYNLSYLDAQSLPFVLDRLVAEGSEWTTAIARHWSALKPGLRVDVGQNAIRATGLGEALNALARVIEALDVPRPTLVLAYRHIRVERAQDLLGAFAAPPTASPGVDAANLLVDARAGASDWSARVDELVADGRAEVLHEGSVSVGDGLWASVWLGDPEALNRNPRFRI